MLVLVTYLLVAVACSAQDCDSLPQSFVSTEEAKQMVKKATFRYVDHIDTKKSSWIGSADYYSCDGKLGFFLLVTKTDRKYLFQGMPIHVWTGFKNADSYGEFYNHYIRNKYRLKIN